MCTGVAWERGLPPRDRRDDVVRGRAVLADLPPQTFEEEEGAAVDNGSLALLLLLLLRGQNGDRLAERESQMVVGAAVGAAAVVEGRGWQECVAKPYEKEGGEDRLEEAFQARRAMVERVVSRRPEAHPYTCLGSVLAAAAVAGEMGVVADCAGVPVAVVAVAPFAGLAGPYQT